MIKSKKGASIAIITQAMIIVFSMFMIISTFVVSDAVSNKNKKNYVELRTYCSQLGNDFIMKNEEFVWQNKAVINDVETLLTQSVDSFANSYIANNGYQEGTNGFVKENRDEHNNLESVVYSIMNLETGKKYEVKISLNFEEDNNTITLSLKRTYSTTVYFVCTIQYNETNNSFFDLKVWNLKI